MGKRDGFTIKVGISTYGSVNLETGWSYKEITLTQESATIEALLRSVELRDGRIIFDLVGDEGGIKDNYVIWLNGRVLDSHTALKMKITNEDQVIAGSFIRAIGGG